MSAPTPSPYDYQIEGGALLVDAPTYVKRQADDALYKGLLASKFCYVLNARQMGKSSLKVRTMQRLQAAGMACAAVDLQGIGTSVTEEQWYVSIINRVSRGLGLRRQFDLNAWWTEHYLLSNVQRLTLFWEMVVLPVIPQPIVIFFDEVDLTLSLPFSSDDFFGALRECYNRRADEPEFRRLTFALLGVATPADLIQNKQITPFNIGQPIDLTGFRLEEAEPLLPGLAASGHPQAVLRAVLDWTGGQPFLTQKLCKLVATAEACPQSGQETQWVEQVVNTKIIKNWETQDIPQHLSTIRDRLLHTEERSGQLLGLYQQILQQGEIATNDSSEQLELRLTGLVVKRDSKLRVYNPIYAAVFNQNWLERALANLRPYAESLNAWVASNRQDESRLLRGQALETAQAWATNKNLSDIDYRFLDASRELEQREVQQELEVQQQANQLLVSANRKAQKRIRFGWRVLIISLVLSGIAIALGSTYFSKAQDAILQVQGAKKELTSIKEQQKWLETDKQKLQTQLRNSRNRPRNLTKV